MGIGVFVTFATSSSYRNISQIIGIIVRAPRILCSRTAGQDSGIQDKVDKIVDKQKRQERPLNVIRLETEVAG